MSSNILAKGRLLSSGRSKVLPKSWSKRPSCYSASVGRGTFLGCYLWRRPKVVLIMHNIPAPASLIIIATLTCFILWFRCLLLSIALGCDLQEQGTGKEEATAFSVALAIRNEHRLPCLVVQKWGRWCPKWVLSALHCRGWIRVELSAPLWIRVEGQAGQK